MEQPHWQGLIVEPGATPPPLSDEQFRSWMTERRIFVSSTMDEEMTPARIAARDVIRQWGGAVRVWTVLPSSS